MRNFPSVLKENRLRSGLTQKDLADRVGLDHSYISKIERGTADPPSRDKVIAIADALGLKNKTQRTFFFLAAGYVGFDDLEQLDGDGVGNATVDGDSPFSGGALNFPDTSKIEEGELLERIKQLLNNSEISSEEKKEFVDILRSFINWLEFRIREKNE